MSDQKIYQNGFGLNGMEVITDTAAHTGTFIALQVISDAVISAITAPQCSGNNLTGITLFAGTTIFTPFTSITLTSGQVIAYKE